MLTNTLAIFRSADIRTSVMVTNPNAAMSSWRVRITLRLCLTSSATFSARIDIGGRLRQNPLGFDHVERLDRVADLDVVVSLEADAAFVPLLHLADVVLEALQRRNPAGEEHDAVAEQAHLVVAVDLAVLHVTAG